VVMGLLERDGDVQATVVPDTKKETLQGEVRQRVDEGATLYTDALPSYQGLNPEYVHQFVDHAVAYVEGKVHTNGIENFWSLFKRCIKGTYVSVEPDHLLRYVDEEAFRFNNRKGKDAQRFEKALGSIEGRRLTYQQLIGGGGRRGT
jgi:transposase-like protein